MKHNVQIDAEAFSKFVGFVEELKLSIVKQPNVLASLPDELIAPEAKKALGEWIDSQQPEPVEPHAELKAMYEKQVKDGTVDDFVWEYLHPKASGWYPASVPPAFHEYQQYRCTPKPTCQVRNDDTGELKTMTREAAKKLQAKLGDTVEWFDADGYSAPPACIMELIPERSYTYKQKANLVKLTIDYEPAKMLTPAQCEAERLARIDTHDVYVRDIEFTQDWNILTTPSFSSKILEYRLIPKPLKQLSWSSVPVRVMTNKGELRGAYIDTQGNCMLDIERVAGSGNIGVAINAKLPAKISLAPASEQPWIAVKDDDPQAFVKICFHLIAKGIQSKGEPGRFKVTGLAEGYELK